MLNRFRWVLVAKDMVVVTRDALIYGARSKGTLVEKIDAAARYVQFQTIESEIDRLNIGAEEREELRKAWLETPSTIPSAHYRKCEGCFSLYDPLHVPASGIYATRTKCSACVQAEIEAAEAKDRKQDEIDVKETYGRDAHRNLEQAAQRAVQAGWDFDKFQDEGAAYFLSFAPAPKPRNVTPSSVSSEEEVVS